MGKKFGGFPGGFDMNAMMKQAQQLQEKLLEAKREAEEEVECEASAGGGMVTAKANGKGEIKSLKLEKEVVDPNDVEMLQDLVVAACNEAIRKAKEGVMEKLKEVDPGLSALFEQF